MEKWIFWPTAVISLISAGYVLLARNAVHSALALVLNFFTLAVFYVLLDAHFLAVAQIIVYAGAIMVLFLFVIMLLGVDREENVLSDVRLRGWFAVGFAVALSLVLIITLRLAFGATTFTGLADANRSGNVQGLGRLLFTKYLWPFEVTSLLLIAAAIGAMVVGRRSRHDEDEEVEQ